MCQNPACCALVPQMYTRLARDRLCRRVALPGELAGGRIQRLRFSATPQFAANGIGRDVAHDSTQPLAEFRGIAQIFEPMPRGDKRLLSHVLGRAEGAASAVGERTDEGLIALDDFAERLTVAFTG